jgi:hypothetical protein
MKRTKLFARKSTGGGGGEITRGREDDDEDAVDSDEEEEEEYSYDKEEYPNGSHGGRRKAFAKKPTGGRVRPIDTSGREVGRVDAGVNGELAQLKSRVANLEDQQTRVAKLEEQVQSLLDQAQSRPAAREQRTYEDEVGTWNGQAFEDEDGVGWREDGTWNGIWPSARASHVYVVSFQQ